LNWLRLEGHDAGELVGVAHLACAAGIGLMGVMVAGTFASKPRPLAVPLQMMKPPVIR
jgi:hypothetical protein